VSRGTMSDHKINNPYDQLDAQAGGSAGHTFLLFAPCVPPPLRHPLPSSALLSLTSPPSPATRAPQSPHVADAWPPPHRPRIRPLRRRRCSPSPALLRQPCPLLERKPTCVRQAIAWALGLQCFGCAFVSAWGARRVGAGDAVGQRWGWSIWTRPHRRSRDPRSALSNGKRRGERMLWSSCSSGA
jgi:hypothetical protein